MKKLILVLAILAIASPVFGLSFSLNRLGTSKNVDVHYTGADPCNLPRGIALVITVTGGKADINNVYNYKTNVSTSTNRGFGIYPATITINGAGDVNNWGSPIASAGDPLPANADQNLPSNNLVLEFGSLYAPVGDSINSPATDGNLCTLTLDCNGQTVDPCIVMNAETTYRGGIVLENGNTFTLSQTQVVMTGACLTQHCPQTGVDLYVGEVFAVDCCAVPVNLTITSAMITKWVYLGYPCCWVCPTQKCGNGIYSPTATKNRVDLTDLSALQTAYLKQYTQPGYNPCLDFNLSGRIDLTDLSNLQLHYLKVVGSSGCL